MSDALAWYKSSYSDDEGGACVEVAAQPSRILVRDSKVADGPRVAISPTAWAAFAAYIAHAGGEGVPAR